MGGERLSEKILIRQTKPGHNPLKSRGDVIYPDSETERNRMEQSWDACLFIRLRRRPRAVPVDECGLRG